MWTGVSIEIIAKLDATARTFFSKHNLAKSTGSAAFNLKGLMEWWAKAWEFKLASQPWHRYGGVVQIARPD